jgi:methylenetetrahydrofolate dehydrogenase (NADP+)/methenyltetrahydrofolate cyclohydrolase
MSFIEMTSHTITEKLYADLKKKVEAILATGMQPSLAVVLVGHDPKSELYVSSIKQKRAEELGIEFTIHRLDQSVSQEAILETIEKLNAESSVSGIIVQLPLPEHLDTNAILNTIDSKKDVDGLRSGSPYLPPTVAAITQLFESYDIPLADKKITIVGKGRLVGAPLFDELKKLHLNVEACDEWTDDLVGKTVSADILISATGDPGLIKPEMVKDGAVVIDVDEDVHYETVAPKTSYITPQRGGVGPLTVAFLLSNVVEAAT